MTEAIHLCIATGQNLANLIPAVQLGATDVWILRTPAMARSATHLADALRARGIRTRIVELDDTDVAALKDRADQLACDLAGQEVTVNLTGGTKLMTVALVRSLLAESGSGTHEGTPSLIYTDTERRRIDLLEPRPGSVPLKAELKLNDVLMVQGYRRQAASGGAEAAEWMKLAEERADLTRALGDDAGQIGDLIGSLNRAAHRALNQPQGPFLREQPFRTRLRGKAEEALERAQRHGLLVWEKGAQVVFQDRDAAMYLGGGWVEEYAALKVKGAQADGGWAPRMQISHVDTESQNEIDVALVNCNRMLLVECKAARPDADEKKVADWIYKASQLARQVGGSHASALLLSARELRDEYRRRAEEYGVAVLAGSELKSLGKWLRDWMAR